MTSIFPLINKKGFTLVEMLLYVTISSALLLSMTVFFGALISVNIKNQNMNDVNEQGILVMELMTQTIRNARAVSSFPFGASSTTLALTVKSSSSSPTIFDLATGTLRLKEGTETHVPLTNSKVTASSLLFLNSSASSTDGGSIEVSFILTYVSTSTAQEYVYSKSFKRTASFH